MSDTRNFSRTSYTGADDKRRDRNQENTEPSRKRRRSLRKGTHSCWACKRRKEKCWFDDDHGDVCVGCLRRGTKCISQQYADNDEGRGATPNHGASRLRRIEDMVAQLTSQVQDLNQGRRQAHSPYTPPITSTGPGTGSGGSPSHTAPLASTAHHGAANESNTALTRSSAKLRELSQTLQDSLPCAQDIRLLREATTRRPVFSIVHLTTSYTTLRRDGFCPTDGVLPEPPLTTPDPMLMAKYMLQLAVFLQEMHTATHPELSRLMEPVAALAERCAHTAISLVTRQDELLGSVESLEAVVLESVYQCNSGRLRLSWMAAQRAMALARTMGLHLAATAGNNSSRQQRETANFIDPVRTRPELPNLWFRMVHFDLQLSRMLGLPPGAAHGTETASLRLYDPVIDTPEGYLEHVYRHVMVLTLAQRSSDMSPPDLVASQALDHELRRAAGCVPAHWWMPPNLVESSKSPHKLFWDMRRLVTQMLHYDLRSQLNVPYMLSAKGKADDHEEADRQRCEMARIACADSSRQVLSRFILLRDFNQTASSCRFPNFLGLMAAITLVLAHLGGSHRRGPQDEISSQVDSLLSHQAPSDRTMMEQALETMLNVGHASGDALSAQSAHVLHRLLDIEASNHLYNTTGIAADVTVHAQSDGQNNASEEGERTFIPYFGVVRIVRQSANDTARGMTMRTTTTASDDVTPAAESGYYSHTDDNLVDPLLLDLRNDHSMSQSIDMTFLDAFLKDQ